MVVEVPIVIEKSTKSIEIINLELICQQTNLIITQSIQGIDDNHDWKTFELKQEQEPERNEWLSKASTYK